MFIILVYDANEKRVAKYLKLMRQYLTHVQNSVFEGELTPAQFKELKIKIKKLMNEKEDSVLIYEFRTKKYYKRESIGLKKPSYEDFII